MNLLPSFAIGVLATIAVCFPTQPRAEALQSVEVNGELTETQLNVLAEQVRRCKTIDEYRQIMLEHKRKTHGDDAELSEKSARRAFGFVRKCVLKAYDLDNRNVRSKNARLQQIYNALVEKTQAEGPALKAFPGFVDGYQRFKIYTTTSPGDAFCNEEEWLQIAFDETRMMDRPITRNEMERFVGNAFVATIGQATCTNTRPKKVNYVFTLGDTVIAEKMFKPRYGYVMRTLMFDRSSATAFGKAVGGEILEAAYAAR
ncbi:hypothetical protein [Stappia sp. ES.058]|uniref:hypothetical protein n=1 Tax=Stappia sp. ES.058 TaxID=1881061 RepID=UPI00087BFC4A|nr:hypothetical protein [Stappia sp. ES.058]SDU17389.1 hypothetical protein SAMN05428979_2080 [Stappia sp. ES.058]